MSWNFDDSRPIWPQIKEKLMKDIVSGKYEYGSPFPTVRELAQEAKVNRNTMQRALSELESEGLIITNRTSGRTVTTDTKLFAEIKNDLAKGYVEQFLDETTSLGFSFNQIISMIKEFEQKSDRQ